MSLPSCLICFDEDIRLIRLKADDVDWVVQHTDAELLENVFSSSENMSLSEFYTAQFAWTSVYLITNANNDTFGIIRVVPEMDNVLSMHGIGWPNTHHFSRVYFKAWIGIHQYLLNKQSLLRTNCRDDNFGAMNVLLKTGYEATYLNIYNEGERNLNFILSSEKFWDSPLFLMNKGVSFSSDDIDAKRNFKPINVHSAKSLTQKVELELINIEVYCFKSIFIQNRQDIQIPKNLIRLSFQGLFITFLVLHFEHYRQIHMESSGRLSFLRMMQVKSEWRTQLKLNQKDMIFTYFESSNKPLISQLMSGDFIYRGEDVSRSCMIWSNP